MGYNTTFRGELTIEPPIPWADIKDSPFLPANAKGYANRDVMFRIEETERDTAEGVLIVREAVALESTWEDEVRGYHFVEHVQEAVSAHTGHAFTGRIDAEGEDSGDMWRLKVIAGCAMRFEPKIVWPEESE